MLTAATAGRIALAAQGFADPRPTGEPTRRHLAKALSRVQVIQLDSVNVAVRAHYMPLFSRLGGYPTALVDDAAWTHSARRPRQLVEYWAHMASLIPVADWPLFRWRMRQFADPAGRHWQAVRTHPGLVNDVLTAVKELGPISAGAVERELGLETERAKGTWWDRSEVKKTCEFLFATGELSVGGRRGFERQYDLSERVLPTDVHGARMDDADAFRELVRRAAIALGVATEADLRDYYRLPVRANRTAVAELVELGVLRPVEVRGWRSPAYLHAEARIPRRIRTRALLCPFDPLVWHRDRATRLFDFDYRIEIYVPEHKRVHGYYVFPFLLDEAIVARVDLKADRAAGALRVPGAFAEPGADLGRVAVELAAELRSMADWLGLADVIVGERGDLAAALTRILG
ncbi:MAG TPA: crosslink repair DNA glycosylase YcaQ family protein [Pseudonocardiaceae bacterium]|nr:crosslink repair DNA glycosylase YcaQ family protein [Pseudonocardiaceae bacterium]